MPTIIALDASLSMQRIIPGRSDDNPLTYHQLALKGITQFLEYLSQTSKLEYVSLVTYSSVCEIKVDFTRDYDQVRQVVKKVEPIDKLCMVSMLKSLACILSTTWGVHCHANVVAFTDCGLGFGGTALKEFLHRYVGKENEPEFQWVTTLRNVKFNFVCIGLNSDNYFIRALAQYQKLFNCTRLRANLFRTRPFKDAVEFPDTGNNNNNTCSVITANIVVPFHSSHKNELGRTAMLEIIEQLCEVSFRPYEAILKCGGSRLETPIIMWPPPQPYENGKETRTIANKIEICGFLSLADIGSPASLSRHLIVPKGESREKITVRRSSDKSASTKVLTKIGIETNPIIYEFEKLEQDIREANIALKDSEDSGDDVEAKPPLVINLSEPHKENACLLLHNALKMENLAALVLLGKNWYGFVYAFADTKKKSNLLLNIMPPLSNIIPWLGDLNMLGFPEDIMHNDMLAFPIKAEKRSYSQNLVVWIKYLSIQADVQKVLRHAKKIPEKTQHFYKELNRIRRFALSIGYLEMLDGLAQLFETEALHYAQINTHSESALQLKHAAIELRKATNCDIKVSITPLQKYPVPAGGGVSGAGGGVVDANVQGSGATSTAAGFTY